MRDAARAASPKLTVMASSTSATGDDAPGADTYRNKPRRRGDELNDAIYAATLAELTESGYADLTMERVAARAKASKGSLYRRWPSRTELVVDAIRSHQPEHQVPDTGDLRADLLTLMGKVAASLEGARGEAVRGLAVEVTRNPELLRTLRAEVMDSAVPPMLEVLRRGAVRGVVRPSALTPLVAQVGPGLIRQHFMAYGSPVAGQFIADVVDQVVLPLVIAHADGDAPIAKAGSTPRP
jgi:AcrR family transcriptional regulator